MSKRKTVPHSRNVRWEAARLAISLRFVSALSLAGIVIFGLATRSQSQDKASKRNKIPPGFQVSSDAFANGRLMPSAYTCDGGNISPPLVWTGAPSGVKSFAIICDDRDAQHIFVHWIIYNIPGTANGLPTRVPPDVTLENGAKQGRNGFNGIGYGGPCPPGGNPHHYFFHVYAIDSMLDPTISSREDLDKAMKGHVLSESVLMGMY
ncbi:MAG TPA: YbhB/YbcL family Raf kinase inhibitor-like protein [Blastocatellia bacterium]